MGDYKIAASIMTDCKLGTSQVDKIYLGNELLWSKYIRTNNIITTVYISNTSSYIDILIRANYPVTTTIVVRVQIDLYYPQTSQFYDFTISVGNKDSELHRFNGVHTVSTSGILSITPNSDNNYKYVI